MANAANAAGPRVAAITAKLREAIAHHQRGALALAEPLYREILDEVPGHFDALHLLGLVRYANGRYDDAVVLIERAIAVEPGHAAAHSNLGLALQKTKRLAEAVASFDRALALNPGHVGALYNRGNVLAELQRPAEALASYDRALALTPGNANALINRGHALRALERPHEALASYDRALALAPADADAWYGRGKALQELGRPQDALASYDRAIAARPDDADARYGRANVLLGLARHEEALAGYDDTLRLAPRHVGALNNRGIALAGLERFADAVASYDRALAIKPANAEMLANRGNALHAMKRYQDAVASYDRALALRPGYPDALYGRGSALQVMQRHGEACETYVSLLELAPDYPFAKGQLLHAKMFCCDWTGLTLLAEAISRDVAAGKKSAEPFGYLGICDSPPELLRCAEIFAAERYPRSPAPLYNGERYGNARIRVGYVSGEFLHQATSFLTVGLFERHDRDRFELFAFDNGWDDGSEIRRRIERAFDEIVTIAPLSDAAAAAAIRARKIDILVNLNGYFGRARQGVFSRRPCPIQVNYLGFPGTIGADYLDYIIADPIVIPPAHRAFYTEKVVLLPDTYQVNDRQRRIAASTPSRVEAGLPDTGFVFCCFNNNYKITPAMFEVWMRLLRQVQGSVLWLLEDNRAAARNLRLEAQRRGVAPERLVFAPRLPLEQHLARHRLAGLFLDTLPCNAHTTASDALWAGLPVLTVLGNAFPGRVAASLLAAAGLPELVAADLDAYESLALRLAATPAALREFRERLAGNRTTCPLFDTDRFRRHIEAAFSEMWQRHQRGEPPAGFAVPPLG